MPNQVYKYDIAKNGMPRISLTSFFLLNGPLLKPSFEVEQRQREERRAERAKALEKQKTDALAAAAAAAAEDKADKPVELDESIIKAMADSRIKNSGPAPSASNALITRPNHTLETPDASFADFANLLLKEVRNHRTLTEEALQTTKATPQMIAALLEGQRQRSEEIAKEKPLNDASANNNAANATVYPETPKEALPISGWTQQDDAKFLQLLGAGRSWKTISKAFDVDKEALRKRRAELVKPDKAAYLEQCLGASIPIDQEIADLLGSEKVSSKGKKTSTNRSQQPPPPPNSEPQKSDIGGPASGKDAPEKRKRHRKKEDEAKVVDKVKEKSTLATQDKPSDDLAGVPTSLSQPGIAANPSKQVKKVDSLASIVAALVENKDMNKTADDNNKAHQVPIDLGSSKPGEELVAIDIGPAISDGKWGIPASNGDGAWATPAAAGGNQWDKPAIPDGSSGTPAATQGGQWDNPASSTTNASNDAVKSAWEDGTFTMTTPADNWGVTPGDSAIGWDMSDVGANSKDTKTDTTIATETSDDWGTTVKVATNDVVEKSSATIAASTAPIATAANTAVANTTAEKITTTKITTTAAASLAPPAGEKEAKTTSTTTSTSKTKVSKKVSWDTLPSSDSKAAKPAFVAGATGTTRYNPLTGKWQTLVRTEQNVKVSGAVKAAPFSATKDVVKSSATKTEAKTSNVGDWVAAKAASSSNTDVRASDAGGWGSVFASASAEAPPAFTANDAVKASDAGDWGASNAASSTTTDVKASVFGGWGAANATASSKTDATSSASNDAVNASKDDDWGPLRVITPSTKADGKASVFGSWKAAFDSAKAAPPPTGKDVVKASDAGGWGAPEATSSSKTDVKASDIGAWGAAFDSAKTGDRANGLWSTSADTTKTAEISNNSWAPWGTSTDATKTSNPVDVSWGAEPDTANADDSALERWGLAADTAKADETSKDAGKGKTIAAKVNAATSDPKTPADAVKMAWGDKSAAQSTKHHKKDDASPITSSGKGYSRGITSTG